jgi:hypothetical protein
VRLRLREDFVNSGSDNDENYEKRYENSCGVM